VYIYIIMLVERFVSTERKIIIFFKLYYYCVCCVTVRVSYIFCDPVLACITVIPVLLLHRLPQLIEAYLCVERATVHDELCMNHSSNVLSDSMHGIEGNLTRRQKETLYDSVVSLILCVQLSK